MFGSRRGNGFLSEEDTIEGFLQQAEDTSSDEELRAMFLRLVDGDVSGQWTTMSSKDAEHFRRSQSGIKLPPSNGHDDRGIIQIEASSRNNFRNTSRRVNAKLRMISLHAAFSQRASRNSYRLSATLCSNDGNVPSGK
jgi:hypothetical protein